MSKNRKKYNVWANISFLKRPDVYRWQHSYNWDGSPYSGKALEGSGIKLSDVDVLLYDSPVSKMLNFNGSIVIFSNVPDIYQIVFFYCQQLSEDNFPVYQMIVNEVELKSGEYSVLPIAGFSFPFGKLNASYSTHFDFKVYSKSTGYQPESYIIRLGINETPAKLPSSYDPLSKLDLVNSKNKTHKVLSMEEYSIIKDNRRLV